MGAVAARAGARTFVAIAMDVTNFARLRDEYAASPRYTVANFLWTYSKVSALEHVPKKLLDFFDKDMLQLFEFERFLFDHVIPRDREAL
jgi:hypothetical protein